MSQQLKALNTHVTVTGTFRCLLQSFPSSRLQGFPTSSESCPQFVVHFVLQERENSGRCHRKITILKYRCTFNKMYCNTLENKKWIKVMFCQQQL